MWCRICFAKAKTPSPSHAIQPINENHHNTTGDPVYEPTGRFLLGLALLDELVHTFSVGVLARLGECTFSVPCKRRRRNVAAGLAEVLLARSRQRGRSDAAITGVGGGWGFAC